MRSFVTPVPDVASSPPERGSDAPSGGWGGLTAPERRPPAGRGRRPAAAGARPRQRSRPPATRPAPPAGSGPPPAGWRPNRAPTNAPGRVTRPVVRVWSSAGTSASATATPTRSAVACRVVAPRANLPSTSARRPRSSATKRRPASVEAVMAPPTVMPTRATTFRTCSASAPVAKTTLVVTVAPVVTAATTAIGRHQRRRVGSSASRGVTVAVAAATITASTGSTARGARNTAPAPGRPRGAGSHPGWPTTPPRGSGARRPPAEAPSHEEQDRQRQDGPGNLVHPLTALCPCRPLGCSG